MRVIGNPIRSPVPDSSPPRTSFVFTGIGQVTSAPFEVLSSPWKLLYTTSWSGPFSLAVQGAAAGRTISGDSVTAGIVYETFIYDWSGPTHFVSSGVPADGQWTVWAIENPSVPTVSPSAREAGILFTFTGTGEVASPPFPGEKAPWKLLYTTSWSGPFHLQGTGGERTIALVAQDSTAGVVRETFVYGLVGSLHLAAIDVPPNGAWSVSVLKVPEADTEVPPGSPPGAVLAYSGAGVAKGPPFTVAAESWRLHYEASWSGPFAVRIVGEDGTESVVQVEVTAGVPGETVVSTITGQAHFDVLSAPAGAVWTLWVIEEA